MQYTRLSHDSLIEFVGAVSYVESIQSDESFVFGAVEDNTIYGTCSLNIFEYNIHYDVYHNVY